MIVRLLLQNGQPVGLSNLPTYTTHSTSSVRAITTKNIHTTQYLLSAPHHNQKHTHHTIPPQCAPSPPKTYTPHNTSSMSHAITTKNTHTTQHLLSARHHNQKHTYHTTPPQCHMPSQPKSCSGFPVDMSQLCTHTCTHTHIHTHTWTQTHKITITRTAESSGGGRWDFRDGCQRKPHPQRHWHAHQDRD
jgi:hypothetical protein